MMRHIITIALCCISCVFWAHGGVGHEQTEDNTNVPALSKGISVYLTTNSKGATDLNGFWRIPGALMGGHATPIEKGERINHMAIWGKYTPSHQWNMQATLAAHDETLSELDMELEQLQINFKPTPTLQIQVGRMNSLLTPSLQQHTAVEFTESSLMADTLFGRHVQDDGVKIQAQPSKNLTIGIEAWKGQSFPATKGKGSQAIFAQFDQQWHQWNTQLGIWNRQTEAISRGDERYNGSGHSHGAVTNTPVDVRFTGRTEIGGLWMDITRSNHSGSTIGMQYEIVRSRSEGELFDTTRKADYGNTYTSYALVPYFNFKKWQLAYRFERIDLYNTLSGSGANLIAQRANLLNDRSPKRETLQATWRVTPDISTIFAYTRDKTLSEQGTHRTSISLKWQK